MSWTFRIGPHDFDTIAGLPPEAHPPLFQLIAALEQDPYANSAPFGHDDGVTREAFFGPFGAMVLLLNPQEKRITPLSFTWAG